MPKSMIAEILSGLPTEILGHYFGKIADFIGAELTDDLTWKKWKTEHGFAKNNSDFPERYAEAMVELKKQEKPKSLQKFFADPSVFVVIHEFWYSGERDIHKLPPVFNHLVSHFMLESEIKGFDANTEVGHFLEIFTEAVNQNETAGGADNRRDLKEILKLLRELEARFSQPNKVHSTLQDKIFIFHNPADRIWVEKHLAPQLENVGLQVHLDPREHANQDWQDLSDTVANCKATVLVFTEMFSTIEQGLIAGLLTERPKKLLALRLGEASVPKEFTDPVSLEIEESRSESFRPLLARLQSNELPVWEPLDDTLIDITSMPNGGEHIHLFGRQRELQILDDAWGKHECHVLSFVAQGGTGKSALFNRWLADMGRDNFRGAGRVLATSFYSQGTGERVTSSDLFINFALNWFGERNFEQHSPWDKGKRLAQLVSEHRTLLILDGLEPLQEGGIVDTGKVKDPALFTLIRDLAKRNEGLCIITSRLQLGGLERQSAGIRQENLEQISDEAGKHILRFAGVKGTDEALAKAVRDFGNHAFAVNLLGAWLYAQPGHGVERASMIPDLPEVTVERGKHPRRVIAAFERILREEGLDEEIRLLRFLGLFDRPVSEEAIAQLHPFQNLYKTLDSLWMFKLIYRDKRHPILRKNKVDMVDCHPLIREHYSEVFAKEEPEVWQKCHALLYEYYKGLPERLYGKFLPDTLEEMEPLFLAVRHGREANLIMGTLVEIYWMRIRRQRDHYLWFYLGGFSYDLSLLASFFTSSWENTVEGVGDNIKPFLYSWTGISLGALGRFDTAISVLEGGISKLLKIENWYEAAVGYNNLSDLYIQSGQIKEAIIVSSEGVQCAFLSQDKSQKNINISKNAWSIYNFGNIWASYKIFSELVESEKDSNSPFNYLYSMDSFYFCEVVIDLCSSERYDLLNEIIHETALKIQLSDAENIGSKVYINKISYGLYFLILGRAYSALSNFENNLIHSYNVELNHRKAIEYLRKSGYVYYIPYAYLSRAAFYRYSQNYFAAEADLEEVLDIAEPMGMWLHLTDYHLETARLRLAQGRKEDALPHIVEATKLVAETGYHRRDKELEELNNLAKG